MKKLVVLLVVLTMIVGLGVYAYADDVSCELSEEDQAYLLMIKKEFLEDQVAEGVLIQGEADELYEALVNETHNNTLRGLGFGLWLRESEYADDAYDIMPHSNQGHGFESRGHRGRGLKSGERKLDGTGYGRGYNNESCVNVD